MALVSDSMTNNVTNKAELPQEGILFLNQFGKKLDF